MSNLKFREGYQSTSFKVGNITYTFDGPVMQDETKLVIMITRCSFNDEHPNHYKYSEEYEQCKISGVFHTGDFSVNSKKFVFIDSELERLFSTLTHLSRNL